MDKEEIKVSLIFLVKDKKILMVSRKDDHTQFGLVGGKMDKEDNEDFIATAIRETKEETGLDVSNQKFTELVDLWYQGNRCKTFLVTDYEGEISTNEKGIVKWGSPSDLLESVFGDYNKIVIENYMNYMDLQKKLVGQKLLN